MNRRHLHRHVARLFAPAAVTTRVGIEQELFAMDLVSGGSVDPDRVRSAVAGRSYARWIGFEPGGQVELSLPAVDDSAAAVAGLARVTAALAADLLARGIVLDARPVRATAPATPRYLRSPRYDAMEAHFDTVGPAGRRMMRATASTQVCLDWWPGAAGLEQWRVLLLAGPFLAAATARGIGPDGRLATWLAVDPSRTAFDDRLLHGEDPVAAYAGFAAGAGRFVGGGAAGHLSTLFPPVRPRGRYLEIRFPDARPSTCVAALVDGLAGLLYDDARRRRALADLAPEEHRLADHWAAAAAGTGDVDRGRALLGGARTEEVAA
ncbi:glutamate-cysteine ligase family protein [Marmoricola sp. RAF53]|uniref:glutamate-cysteine ligase family protein n=1 Tax=Marmoricola sp. RAF53 TaxID=3233059 RepID=UPI003F9E6C1D